MVTKIEDLDKVILEIEKLREEIAVSCEREDSENIIKNKCEELKKRQMILKLASSKESCLLSKEEVKKSNETQNKVISKL